LIVVYQRILERRTGKLYFLVVLVVVIIVIVVFLWGGIERESGFCSSTGRNNLLGSGSHGNRRFLMRRRSRRIPELR
jgi:preprotein translocase subunit SecG